MIDWPTLLATILSNSVLLAVIGFLFKSIFEQILLRDIKNYETRLQAAHDIEIERFRADSQKSIFEYQTRFTKRYEVHAEIIAELYKLLARVQRSLNMLANITSSGVSHESRQETLDEKDRLFYESINVFWDYFDENRLYFDQLLCNKISEFHEEALQVYSDLYSAEITRDVAKYLDSEIEREKYTLQVKSSLQGLDQRIPPIRADIEKDFDKLLGFSSMISRTL